MSAGPMASSTSPASFLIHGTVLNPTFPERTIDILSDWLLHVDDQGFVTHSEAATTATSVALLQKAVSGSVIETGDEGFLLPGFVDTHIHAPQYLNAGTALDKPLMEWLHAYTFSSEARIDSDPNMLGRRVYTKLVDRMVEAGTTAASVFGTLTVEANMVLAKAFQERGIRGQIGKVAMDLNGIESYIETTADSLARTSDFIAALNSYTASFPPHARLVTPVITPRFVPTCSEELLRGLAELAQETGTRVQSHMCEAEDQVEWSKGMWGGKEDVQVLDEMGLLTKNSLMAHCTHTSDAQLSLLSQRGTSISHCPLSNVYFSPERTLPLREAWNSSVAVGLGSDISGGYQLSLQGGMRWAVAVSRLRGGEKAIKWKESVYLATLGGAQAMGLQGVGRFEVGARFDAQLIQLGRKGSKVDWFDKDVDKEELVEKWWCGGDENDRVAVWVQGKVLRWKN